MTAKKPRVVVFGILFWFPLAGVTYQFLHYLIGLRRLGYDVYYVEDSGRWIYDPRLNGPSPDASGNVAAVAPILDAFGFKDRWAFRGNYPGGRCYGMSESAILQLYREADALLNVTGAHELRDEHLTISRRIYLETDPVAAQILVVRHDPKTLSALEAHDMHFTFGENLGAPDCGVPLERFTWQPTRQPVVLDLWAVRDGGPGDTYTTIATWKHVGKDIVYQDETYYWSKDREFIKFIDLPRHTPVLFELATGVDEPVRALLTDHGWRVQHSLDVSRDLDRYRQYIVGSRGEFTVAKDQNIRLRSGWFSDRSACYLAAGRPVITQETGFSNVLPTGRGLFAFRTTDDVLAAVDAIESDYAAHSAAARQIAQEYFAAERVIDSLMTRAGI
ncbi:MAG: hypothetical protein HYX76_10970 [Acidobacteria bacterium]|nr:hypothetical protein [Acidobacteriota bacterium]